MNEAPYNASMYNGSSDQDPPPPPPIRHAFFGSWSKLGPATTVVEEE